MSGEPVQDERQKMPLAVIDRRGGRRKYAFYSKSGLGTLNNKLNHVVATCGITGKPFCVHITGCLEPCAKRNIAAPYIVCDSIYYHIIAYPIKVYGSRANLTGHESRIANSGAVVTQTGIVQRVAIKPPPSNKTRRSTIRCSCENQAQHQNKRSQKNQFPTHISPPSKKVEII